MHQLAGIIGEKNAVRCYKLCLRGISDMKELVHRICPGRHFASKPSLQFASETKHRHALHKEYSMRLRNGFNVNWLERPEIEALFGFTSAGAILSDDAAEIDAYALTHELLRFSENYECRIFDNTTVRSVRNEHGYVELMTDTGHTVRSKKLVLACGYESLEFISKPLAELQSTYAAVSEQMPGRAFWYGNSMIWETRVPYCYYRITDDSRILIGGKDDPFYNPSLRDNRIRKKAAMLENSFHRLFPNIPFKTDFSWAGTFAVSKDGLPFIGEIPGMPHVYLLLGCGGNGITFSMIGAGIIRDLIKGKRNNNDALHFSVNR